MKWFQKEIQLQERPRGFHIITDEILSKIPELKEIKTGLANIFIKHTSASLSINENADPDVLHDLELYFDTIVPEQMSGMRHVLEGPDDMPAHVKASLTGSSITIPITNHALNLGIWQGIYLCEFRNHARGRNLIATVSW
jgi:secondary thiamine-phosphate synthase enzyme